MRIPADKIVAISHAIELALAAADRNGDIKTWIVLNHARATVNGYLVQPLQSLDVEIVKEAA